MRDLSVELKGIEPSAVLEAFRTGRFEAHVTSVTIVEIARTLARPKLVTKYHIRWTEVLRFIGDLVSGGAVHHVADPPARCRDRTDDVLLELGVRLAPCAVVTGDHDLLSDTTLISTMNALGVAIRRPVEFVASLHTT